MASLTEFLDSRLAADREPEDPGGWFSSAAMWFLLLNCCRSLLHGPITGDAGGHVTRSPPITAHLLLASPSVSVSAPASEVALTAPESCNTISTVTRVPKI